MSVSRRIFIRNSSLALTGSVFLNKRAFSIETPEVLGIQLYSVREAMLKNPLDTLKQLSSMGYKYVEHANYINRKFYGYSAKEFKSVLNGLDLKMPSGHTVMNKTHWDDSKKDFTDLWKNTVEDAAVLGQQYVISPWMDADFRKTYDDFMKLMDIFNKSGELCKKNGMKFGYHNHDFEFSEELNGAPLYDLILKNTDPDLVIQQLDMGNLYNGGAKALDIVKKYPGRFQSLHVKDEILSEKGNEKYESCILGQGVVNVKELLGLIKKDSKKVHYIIEQESYQGKDPVDCAREDLAIMKKWGY